MNESQEIIHTGKFIGKQIKITWVKFIRKLIKKTCVKFIGKQIKITCAQLIIIKENSDFRTFVFHSF